MVMGLFGVSEVLINMEQILKQEIYKGRIKNLLPSRKTGKIRLDQLHEEP
jgi:TctA family transporter